MKLFICGLARHGKDEAAKFLRKEFDLSFESSSHVAMNEFLRDELVYRYGLAYKTGEECFADRVNHREKWFQIISDYCLENPSKLSELIFSKHDIYVGIRNRVELYDAREKGLADLAIWIDASERYPEKESTASNNITAADCDLTVLNNGTLEQFRDRLRRVFSLIIPKEPDLAELTRMEGVDMMPIEVVDCDGNTVGYASELLTPEQSGDIMGAE